VLAEGREVLAASVETGYLSTVMATQAHVAAELGRDAEALAFAEEARSTAQPDDFEPHAREQLVRARVLARRGDLAGADELIASAADIVDATDYILLHIDLALSRAEVASVAGRPGEQRAALERALSVAEAKGDLLAAGRARRGLESL